MGKDVPIISKTLRLVSFSLTLVMIIIFVTIGYSAAQVFEGVIASGDQFKTEQRVSGNNVELVFKFSLPNKGIYPLELDLIGEVSQNKVRIGRVVSGPHVIQPGDSKDVEFAIPLRQSAMSDAELVRKLLFDDSDTIVNVTTRIGFQPFAFINVSSGFISPSGAVFSGLKIEQQGVSAFNRTHSLIELKVYYTNKSPVPFNGKIGLVVTSTPTRTARGIYGSTTFDVSVNNNEAITQTVFLPIRNEAIGSGDYKVEITASAGPIAASTESTFRGR